MTHLSKSIKGKSAKQNFVNKREREREREKERKKKNTKLNTSLLGKQTLMKLKLNNNKNIHGSFQTDTRVA